MFPDAKREVLQFGESLHWLAELQPQFSTSQVHRILQ